MIDDDSPPNRKDLLVGMYCLVRYIAKKSIKYYLGIIQENQGIEGDDAITIKFLKRLPSSRQSIAFIVPEDEELEIDDVDFDDIVKILSPPASFGGTKRMASRLVFNDLGSYF